MAIYKTLNMAATTGYTVSLVPAGSNDSVYTPTELQITATVACWIKVLPFSVLNVLVPSAPVATPAPGVGVVADWYHMSAAQTIVLGIKRGSNSVDTMKVNMENFQFVQVWNEAAAGELKVVAV